jgi:hypothetical protein
LTLATPATRSAVLPSAPQAMPSRQRWASLPPAAPTRALLPKTTRLRPGEHPGSLSKTFSDWLAWLYSSDDARTKLRAAATAYRLCSYT